MSATLSSPKKTHSRKFLRYLRENNYISKGGEEFSQEEVDHAYFAKVMGLATKEVDQAFQQREEEMLASPEYAEVMGFFEQQTEVETVLWPLKERLNQDLFPIPARSQSTLSISPALKKLWRSCTAFYTSAIAR